MVPPLARATHLQCDLDFDGGIAPTVEDFTGKNVGDGCHDWAIPGIYDDARRFYRIDNALVMPCKSKASSSEKPQ